MAFIIFFGGLIFGIFSLSQIIFTLFSAWPRARRLQRENALARPIPVESFIIAPVIWMAITLFIFWAIYKFTPENKKVFNIAIGISAFMVVLQIPKKNKSLEDDFKSIWGRYLK